MKNIVNCEIIQDLLPSYIDNKVSKGTYDLISEHISNCKECNLEYNNMNVKISVKSDKKHQIDFFKGIHKKSMHLLLVLLVFSSQFFIVSNLCCQNMDDTLFMISLMILCVYLMILKYGVPLFLCIDSFMRYKKTNKKILLVCSILAGGVYIFFIVSAIKNIIDFGF